MKNKKKKKKTARVVLSKAVLIEQITERLYGSATDKETLDSDVMEVKQIDSYVFQIELSFEQICIVAMWAKVSHISEEEVIEEWLSKHIDKHSEVLIPKGKTEYKEGQL